MKKEERDRIEQHAISYPFGNVHAVATGAVCRRRTLCGRHVMLSCLRQAPEAPSFSAHLDDFESRPLFRLQIAEGRDSTSR